jgi:hypothetical protein
MLRKDQGDLKMPHPHLGVKSLHWQLLRISFELYVVLLFEDPTLPLSSADQNDPSTWVPKGEEQSNL